MIYLIAVYLVVVLELTGIYLIVKAVNPRKIRIPAWKVTALILTPGLNALILAWVFALIILPVHTTAPVTGKHRRRNI